MNDEALKSAEEFAQEIANCKEYKDFIESNKAMKNNLDSVRLMNELIQRQSELRYNGHSDRIATELKDLQEKINNDEIIQDFIITQSELVKLLRETNDIISEEIGFPFAFLKGGGCCG